MGPGNSKEGIRIVDGGLGGPRVRRPKVNFKWFLAEGLSFQGIPRREYWRGLFRKDRERLAVKLRQSKYKKLKSASPKAGG